MITLNIISRIDVDKDFFTDYLFVLYLLRKEKIIVNLKFIGEVFNAAIYNNIVRTSKLFEINNEIEFTKKSIPLTQINPTKNDYFLNASIGDFAGYSSIECIQRKFKTIFYNVDFNLISNANHTMESFCRNHQDLYNLLKQISQNKEQVDSTIINENKTTLSSFFLSEKDKTDLINYL
ncbi:hypothetical protein SAMN05421786_103467 [Chryseobacterium ureilyticum]|uniref:Uncharacterized protein n=1 Tax=Chryseobacterium ureilyticum TaxID=373668 RepID=A0A1N7NEH9_9FLAO|nr:hypothetical protein [Chryseobacterium ureilyticum]SIS96777.1 hypothetical protein SAMN05421786_103467 [Chryseobacterium ureilyticum]